MPKENLLKVGHARVKQLIKESLDSMPQQEKEERFIVPFTPSIPETEEEIKACIDGTVEVFAEDTEYTEEELRVELVDIINYKSLDIDTSLPARQLQEELRAKLESMSNEELLEAGIFGPTITQEEADETRAEHEKWAYSRIMEVSHIEDIETTVKEVIDEHFSKPLKAYKAIIKRYTKENLDELDKPVKRAEAGELPTTYKEIAEKLGDLGFFNGSELAKHKVIFKAYFKERRLTGPEFRAMMLFRNWIEIENAYKESGDWGEVIATVVYDDLYPQEAFIDYLEFLYQTEIKDVKLLQKITGVTHIDSREKGEWVTPKTEAEAKENAIKELEAILTDARYSKYSRAIERAVNRGAKYKDLLQIKPQEYGLPETWSGHIATDQYSSILWAIRMEFLLDEPGGLMLTPDLRSMAKEMEAPYSVLLDAYNFTSDRKNR